MRIGLFLHPYGEHAPGGLGRYVYELSRTLKKEGPEHTYVEYFKKRGPLWLTGVRGTDSTLDAYVFFTPVIPLFMRPKRSIVFVLDFAYWKLRRGIRGNLVAGFLYFLHRRALRQASRVLAISQQTADETVQLCGIPRERIEVIPLSYIPLGKEQEQIQVPNKFFLFAGVLKERKNVLGVVRAFALFSQENTEYHLVIAGKRSGRHYDELVTFVRQENLIDRVHFVGYVTNAQLSYLYHHATALVFPSFIEGFGMPVLEAMQAGLAVITSYSGALSEVAGDAALLVNPYDPSAIASAMKRVIKEPALHEDLIRKGYERAKVFSWNKAARQILAAIEQVVHTSHI